MPEPLVPSDLDLRDFPYMPLDVVRVRDSELAVVSSGEAFRAAVLLWCAAWHQVPAASLPDDDRLLASLAGYGRDQKAWKAVRDDALRGFTLCSDGRFYHAVIAEKALEADGKRRQQRSRTAAASAARRKSSPPPSPPQNDQRHEDRHDDRSEVQGKGTEGNGSEGTKNPDPPSETVPAKSAFTPETYALADRIMLAQGLNEHDPRCIGTVYTAKMWIEEWKWQPDIVVATIERVMAKRDKPPGSLKYFERAIADAHAEAARPAPVGDATSVLRIRKPTFADVALQLVKPK